LQAPNELSGFLNLALAALKRLNQKGEFTNSKSIEETQKEYELNSNPIAAFMEERTQISDKGCEATILYLEYVDWCKSCGKDYMKNIGFSRKLISMGYISHRDNIPGSNSMEKITIWQDLKIKKDKIEQIRTGYEQTKNLSCPSWLDIGKTEIG
jgi:putative DNA primase/helicase